ncbi:MAG: amino acid adenylation domain-containing protein [Bacteroidota bacterium]
MAEPTKKSTLSKWLKLKQQKASATTSTGIEKKPLNIDVPLSFGQERLWLLQELYTDNPFYNYAHQYTFEGAIDLEKLLAAFRAVVARHEVLNSNFQIKNGQPIQVLRDEPSFVQVFDCSNIKNVETRLSEIIESETQVRFDLTKDALLRLTTIKISEEKHIVLLVMHHIIGDRESLVILNQEWVKNYKQLVDNQIIASKENQLQYTDFAHWQRQQSPKKEDLNYWKNQLSGELPTLALPHDQLRPNQATFRGKSVSRTLSTTSHQGLQAICTEYQTTPFAVTLAAFQALLYRYTAQQDILIGVPFSNRDKVELERLIGFFNETLVMRAEINETTTFAQLIAQVKQTTIDAFAHKSVPFSQLVNELNPQRQGSANPIFQAMFVYNAAAGDLDFGEGIVVTEEMLDLGVSKFDLTLFVSDLNNQLRVTFEYSTDLFEVEAMERMLRHLEVLWTSMLKQPSDAIAELPLLTAKENLLITKTWNEQNVPAPEVKTILNLFRKWATEKPNIAALSFQNKSLTYGELDHKSNQVAHFLKQQNQGKANTLVGILTAPSFDQIIGILGILKTGAAYLPLDPDYPKDRLQYMLEDANAQVILTQDELEHLLPENEAKATSIQQILNIVDAKNYVQEEITTSQLAYMIYTSGSTGKPKGVPITHHNLLYSTVARFHFYPQSPGAFLLLSSFSFDSSVAGIFWTLCSGGKLVLTPKRIEQDILQLGQLIDEEQVTHTLMLPSLYQTILEFIPVEQLKSLQIVMVAGEACAPTVVNDHFKKLTQVRLYNEYGPTEGTVWSTAHTMTIQDANAQVPIGRPIPYMKNYILDQQLKVVPIGVIGELYIGGEGVASGYWNRPKLTAEKFVDSPFGQEKLYRTGDLAKYRMDGTIEFLGRADHQVKIRGHRIELEEIKNRLLQLTEVEDALVLVQNTATNPTLFAYLQSSQTTDNQMIRHYLQAQLPAYMVPSAFVTLEQFPQLPNGKVDLKDLPRPEFSIDETTFQAPETTLEKQLIEIWQQVLNLENVSVTDSFFDIGGDSIKSIQVIGKAGQQGIEIAPNLLFEYSSVRALAAYLEQAQTTDWSSIAKLSEGGTQTPLFCIHSGAAHVFFYRSLANYLGDDQPLYALQPKGLDGKTPQHNSIREMATYYIQEIKRIQPEGPYALLGTCFSNAVGLEMAHQLKANEDEIESLIFVDSGPVYLQSLSERGGTKTMSRFFDMLSSGNWKGIQKKLRNRGIRLQRKAQQPFLEQPEQHLQSTITNLNDLYDQYSWRPINQPILFIRSTEFANRSDKDYQVEQWQQLSNNQLDIQVVKGHHLTLFEEPEVEGLAKVLAAYLEKVVV